MSPNVAIPKRKLGKTGLEVTVLGMGGAPLGGLFQVCLARPASHMLVLLILDECCTCSYVADKSSNMTCMLEVHASSSHFQYAHTEYCFTSASHKFAAMIAPWQMQSRYLLQDLTDEQGAEAVRAAFKQGINFFDTSPYYGVTRSEIVRFLSSLHTAQYCRKSHLRHHKSFLVAMAQQKLLHTIWICLHDVWSMSRCRKAWPSTHNHLRTLYSFHSG